eukprot:TRINITY_DN1528_c0_g1_i3.p2 TRINITY_DN1528_c0_g1~~TRINITY_DN1528_c0_g1_i3.p2  ORF type:complete len:283 (-),score=70.51 TRINITY_DN1528_c0_g1_i3:330-1178(-)
MKIKKQPMLSKEEQEKIKLQIENPDDQRLQTLLETKKREQFDSHSTQLPYQVQNKIQNFHHHDDIFEIQPIFDSLETEALLKSKDNDYQQAISELKKEMNKLIEQKAIAEKQLNECKVQQKENEVECKYLQFKWILLMNEREKKCHAEREQLIFELQKAENGGSQVTELNEQIQKILREKEKLIIELEENNKEKNKYYDKKNKYKFEKKQKQERIRELEQMQGSQGQYQQQTEQKKLDDLSQESKKKIDKLENQLYEKKILNKAIGRKIKKFKQQQRIRKWF